MSLLFQGDVLPSVTTSQILMRRHRPNTLLNCDGHFGPRTNNGVQAFQGANSLKKDGIIGKNTWHKFEAVSTFQTIDVVDGTDPSLVALEATDLRSAGFDPIVVFGMSNGLEFTMNQIAARAQTGKVMLLRFHGHGNRGLQNVTGGEINGAPHLASISLSNFGQIEGTLRRITRIFVQFGSVQLLGCDVGGGKGSALVARLAETWGVPVTAGLHTQFGGGTKTFRFEGPVVSAFPGGAAIKTWSKAMEDAHGNVNMG
jgi:peptidoglycan hydrolase-like protein with peptidoglycan-binding domain